MRKSNPYFQFKQFSVNHGNASMKIGTDGVLLGCWTRVGQPERILDIGTGSGVIALMMAQRSPVETTIDAIDIEENDARLAYENVIRSPWPGKIHVHHARVQDFAPGYKYDLIITNPPFFVNSFVPPIQRRKDARHTHMLSFTDLVQHTLRLLSDQGSFNVILPPAEGAIFREHALQNGLFNTRLWTFQGKQSKPIERWLLEFRRIDQETERGGLVMYDENNRWTPEFSSLSREFYLKIP